MKKFIVFILMIVFTAPFTSCAKWKSLTLAQKASTILEAADWGVRANHDYCGNVIGCISDKDLELFRQGEQIVRNVIQDNPHTPKDVIISALKAWEKTLPSDSKLPPYVDALILAIDNSF